MDGLGTTSVPAESLLHGLRAAAEPTRLRLLAVCARGELTVTELVRILGQSQPRVSRHLKLCCDAGLLDRFPEGTRAFYRLAQAGDGAELSRMLTGLLSEDDPVLADDLARLDEAKRERRARADAYFRANAGRWNAIRSLHVPEEKVEAALLQRFDGRPLRDLLDIGTGTGRILELLGERAERAVGVDRNHEMLAAARARIEEKRLSRCQLRHADMYRLPFPPRSFDAVTIHLVLHYADDPAQAVREAARVLRPGGRLALIDFAPHDLESLRESHAHRRMGFADVEVAGWCRAAGLIPEEPLELAGNPLTVAIWTADAPTELPV